MGNDTTNAVPNPGSDEAILRGRTRKADRQRDKASGAIRPKHSIPTRPKPDRQHPPKLPVPGRRPIYAQKDTGHV